MHHKPPPPSAWNVPNSIGLGLLALYFLGGIFLPRWIKKEIPFKKYSWIGTAIILILCLALKPIFHLGWTQALWISFAAILYYILGILLPQQYIRTISWPRYVIAMLFLLMTIGVLLKVGLRLGFNIKYIFTLPQFNFNI